MTEPPAAMSPAAVSGMLPQLLFLQEDPRDGVTAGPVERLADKQACDASPLTAATSLPFGFGGVTHRGVTHRRIPALQVDGAAALGTQLVDAFLGGDWLSVCLTGNSSVAAEGAAQTCDTLLATTTPGLVVLVPGLAGLSEVLLQVFSGDITVRLLQLAIFAGELARPAGCLQKRGEIVDEVHAWAECRGRAGSCPPEWDS